MEPSFRQKVRYRFDNLMARGVGVQILMLALITFVLVLFVSIGVVATGLMPEADGEKLSFARLLWSGLMHTLDAGNLAGNEGASKWAFLFFMLATTLGGIFVLSALIGILNNGFGQLIENLRKGKSLVVERQHTVILGFSPKVYTLLSELSEANANVPGASVVVLADRDKVAMDDEIRQAMEGKKRLRVVTRSGSPLQLADLHIANLAAAKSIIVLSPEHHADGSSMTPTEADTVVLKTLLAVSKAASGHGPRMHIVAEVQDERTMAVARMVVGDDAALILAPPLISRLLVQTGRQSGLSVVYTELLDFGGAEIYMRQEPGVAGKTFREAIFAFEDSSLLGVMTSDDKILLPPPLDRRMENGDRIIAISEDDDTLIVNGRPGAPAEGSIVASPPHSERHKERTLVLGGSERLGLVLRELDAYVAAGSETLVVGEDTRGESQRLPKLTNMAVTFREGDVTDRAVLDSLDVGTFDHVLVLSETAGRKQELADARTLITLLHLRDIARRTGKPVPVTTEMLDIQNRDLAAVAEADDFIISNTLVSLLVSQVSENRHLVRIFDELFSAGGHEIYLKPVAEYVKPGVEIDFYTVAEAAARRGEVALGYRLAAGARDAEKSYGVVVNPKKSARHAFAAADKIIVLAQD